MIDTVNKVATLDLNLVQKALADIQQQAVGMTYAQGKTDALTLADALKKADVGKFCVLKVGNANRLYFKNRDGTKSYVDSKTYNVTTVT